MKEVARVVQLGLGLLIFPLLVAGSLAGTVYGSRRNLPLDERRRVARNVFLIALIVALAGELVIWGACVASLSG
ncbi:MAG: hypothetical protein QOH36_342 [Actinomycetota bacterium]|nr:hypothetical protein [Actinomycetota bacterium]MEA2972555.1 hypothetical protein [Actinomycetota bacterium]